MEILPPALHLRLAQKCVLESSLRTPTPNLSLPHITQKSLSPLIHRCATAHMQRAFLPSPSSYRHVPAWLQLLPIFNGQKSNSSLQSVPCCSPGHKNDPLLASASPSSSHINVAFGLLKGLRTKEKKKKWQIGPERTHLCAFQGQLVSSSLTITSLFQPCRQTERS